MSEEKVWGGGKKRGTDIEELQNKKKKKKTEGRYGYTVTNELKHTVFRPSPNVWYLIGYFSFFFVLF